VSYSLGEKNRPIETHTRAVWL